MDKNIRPNHCLYVKLLILFMGSLLFSIILSVNDVNRNLEIFSSTVISITTGGIASVIVAWLIDFSNCRRKNDEIKLSRNSIYFLLNMRLCFLICVFQEWCKKYDQSANKEKMNWLGWSNRFIEKDYYNKIKNSELEHFDYLLNGVNKELEKLEEKFPIFQAVGIIGPYEGAHVISMVQSFDLLKMWLKSLNHEKEDFESLIKEITKFYDSNSDFCLLNKIDSDSKDSLTDYIKLASIT